MDISVSQITDVRNSSDFKSISFSGYKKSEVKKQILINMFNGKIEPACYWCAELICAGHFGDVWEICLHYLGKHIHLGNPKLPIYLEKRFAVFKNIMQEGMFYDELQLRNHNTIREIFAEIICIFTSSPKKCAFERIKINKSDEFDITQMQGRLKAPSVEYAEPIFQPKDPKELWIAINEFAYHIFKKDIMNACYWIEWVIEFDYICKQKKQKCVCERRSGIPVDAKFQKDIIWLIWDSLILSAKNTNQPFVEKSIKAILNLFCIKFTPTTPKKRRYLLYYAVALLTEPHNPGIELITDKLLLETVITKINKIYLQIKENEDSPNFDYMFSGLGTQRNVEKSIMKLEMMGNLDPVLAGSIAEL